jgi:hypothetical protein
LDAPNNAEDFPPTNSEDDMRGFAQDRAYQNLPQNQYNKI